MYKNNYDFAVFGWIAYVWSQVPFYFCRINIFGFSDSISLKCNTSSWNENISVVLKLQFNQVKDCCEHLCYRRQFNVEFFVGFHLIYTIRSIQRILYEFFCCFSFNESHFNKVTNRMFRVSPVVSVIGTKKKSTIFILFCLLRAKKKMVLVNFAYYNIVSFILKI